MRTQEISSRIVKYVIGFVVRGWGLKVLSEPRFQPIGALRPLFKVSKGMIKNNGELITRVYEGERTAIGVNN